jgi:hypothetical protein
MTTPPWLADEDHLKDEQITEIVTCERTIGRPIATREHQEWIEHLLLCDTCTQRLSAARLQWVRDRVAGRIPVPHEWEEAMKAPAARLLAAQQEAARAGRPLAKTRTTILQVIRDTMGHVQQATARGMEWVQANIPPLLESESSAIAARTLNERPYTGESNAKPDLSRGHEHEERAIWRFDELAVQVVARAFARKHGGGEQTGTEFIILPLDQSPADSNLYHYKGWLAHQS